MDCRFPSIADVATMMLVPAQFSHAAVEMLTIDPIDLAAAVERDASAGGAGATSVEAN